MQRSSAPTLIDAVDSDGLLMFVADHRPVIARSGGAGKRRNALARIEAHIQPDLAGLASRPS
jgi:hypothetical protein